MLLADPWFWAFLAAIGWGSRVRHYRHPEASIFTSIG